jgi:SRSO17 transposase
MDARTLRRLKDELDGFLGELVADLPRSDQRAWATTYIRGLLLDGQRKSIQPMAERLTAIDRSERDYEQSLQQFVNQSPWAAAWVRDRLQQWLAERNGPSPTKAPHLLILDDTGFPKQGPHSVGVRRQYSGTLGKVANCQIAVTLQQVAGESVWCADAELYLPKEWTSDRPRMERAGVPGDVGHRSKWRIGLDMLDRAAGHGLDGVVLADSLYGSVATFRKELNEAGWSYCVGIDSTLKVIDAAEDLGPVPASRGKGRPPSRPERVRSKRPGTSVKRWALDRSEDFRRVSWREGSKGKLSSFFAAWRVRPAGKLTAGQYPHAPCWLIAEWPEGERNPTKFFFSNLPKRTPLRRLVRIAKERWRVELSYREMKDELGLDHFEGRGWRGWHHHITLVMLAYAFLVAHREDRRKKGIEPTI